MAKKYAQTRKDRMDESRGMKRRMHNVGRPHHHGEEKMHRDFVTGHDPEVGRGDFSGMPTETVMASYPPNRARRGSYLDDTISEIDAIQVDSDHQVESHLSHQK